MLYNHLNNEQKDAVSTVKKVDREKANIEAEGGEILIAPDLSTMHRIVGKSHGKGGVPLNVDEDSFIISDDKKMSFTKKESQLFEFKTHGTPSKVLSKEVDLKHHNRMYNVMTDNKLIDPIAKKTAALMMTKNIEKLGQVAYLQEAKKGFPQDIPEFAKGTAPVYNPDLKTKMDQEKQYMKYGGSVLKRYATGGVPPVKPLKSMLKDYGSQQRLDNYLLNGQNFRSHMKRDSTPFNNIDEYQSYLNQDYGNLVFDAYENNSEIFGLNNEAYKYDLRKKYNILPALNKPVRDLSDQEKQLISDEINKLSPEQKYNYVLEQNHDKLWGQRGINLSTKTFNTPEEYEQYIKSHRAVQNKDGNTYYVDSPGNYTYVNYKKPINKAVASLEAKSSINTAQPAPGPGKPNKFNPEKVSYLNQKVPFTPWQLGNMGHSALQAASVKRYMPYRPQINPVTVELEKLNPNQQLNDVDTTFLQTARLNKMIGNASQAGANTADLFVKALQNKSQVRSNYDNQNVQIGNQQNLYNNQLINNTRGQNEQLNKNYYDETVRSYQNYDIEKRGAINQTVSLANAYKSGNMQLQNALAQQQLYPLLDSNGNPRVDAQGARVYGPAYSYDYNGNYIHNKADGFNTANTERRAVDDEIYNMIKDRLLNGSERERAMAISALGRRRPEYKTGGKIPKYPKLSKPKF